MRIKFKHISISNFCGIKQLDAPLYDRTIIKGMNGVGKSSVRNAVFFCLYNKLADGSAPDGIRPHDENGVDIDFIDISVTLKIDVDGREITLCKRQKQKWTKPRNQQEKRFDGNINEFEINGISKREKDYTAYIEKNIAPMETLMLCTNAAAFLGLDNKKRRAKLLSLEKEFSDADVLTADEKYAPLADMFKDGTVDELIARSKKVIKAKNDELKTIPARIDELEKQKVEIDVSELELGKKALRMKIAENVAKQADISKQLEEFDNLAEEISELKLKLSDLERKANEENRHKSRALDEEISAVDMSVQQHNRTIILSNEKITNRKRDVARCEEKLNQCRKEWTRISSLEFDENGFICPYCGQEYPEDKKGQKMADFEEEKSSDLEQIAEDGNDWKRKLKDAREEIEKLERSVEVATKQKEIAEKRSEELEKELERIPQSIDISDRPEAQEISRQIAEKESALKKRNSADEIRQKLNFVGMQLQKQLTEIERQIAKSENNVRIEERIEELHAEQRGIAQKIADEEKTLDLLEDFNREKVSLLTNGINQHFDLVKWQMFKPQINGGFSEVCIPQVSGTSYDGLLNNGNKMLAEIDICKAFQRVNDIVCPIMADNAESVDSWRIPQMDSQMLLFMRTDDEALTIREAAD